MVKTDSAVLLQRADAPSLLRLLLNFDQLESAAELVLEYVDAILGRGHQYFGIQVRKCKLGKFFQFLFWSSSGNEFLLSFQNPLSATSPPAWLPYTAIDQLLRALSETQTHSAVSHFLFP